MNDDRRTGLLRAAVISGAPASEFRGLPLPRTHRAAVTRRTDVERASAIPPDERDLAEFLHVEEVPTPDPAPDEVLVAVAASSINYNTVWSATFTPVPTFAFLDRLAAEGGWSARHGGDRHVLGSDAAGIVIAVGELVRNWSVGDAVAVHGNWVSAEDPVLYGADAMRAPSQRAWGFETNFGGLADLALVKASQLLPKAAHLTWDEVASTTLCNATAYRMLVSPNGAPMRVGDRVLVWGATGGIGSFAVQLALAAGAEPICVVGSAERAERLRRFGVHHVIDRRAEGYRFVDEAGEMVPSEVDRFARRVRDLAGGGVDIVFEHPGRETMPASIAACRRGGKVVTCAATTGHRITLHPSMTGDSVDVIGSHFANYDENWRANELLRRGIVQPTLTVTERLDDVAAAAAIVREGAFDGKVGIACLAPAGSGVTDTDLRERIGEERIRGFELAGVSRPLRCPPP